jgi:hypothetical protein
MVAFVLDLDPHDPLAGSARQSLTLELDLRRNTVKCEACAVLMPSPFAVEKADRMRSAGTGPGHRGGSIGGEQP